MELSSKEGANRNRRDADKSAVAQRRERFFKVANVNRWNMSVTGGDGYRLG